MGSAHGQGRERHSLERQCLSHSRCGLLLPVHGVLCANGEKDVPCGRARDRIHEPIADALDFKQRIGTILQVAIDLATTGASLDGEARSGKQQEVGKRRDLGCADFLEELMRGAA